MMGTCSAFGIAAWIAGLKGSRPGADRSTTLDDAIWLTGSAAFLRRSVTESGQKLSKGAPADSGDVRYHRAKSWRRMPHSEQWYRMSTGSLGHCSNGMVECARKTSSCSARQFG